MYKALYCTAEQSYSKPGREPYKIPSIIKETVNLPSPKICSINWNTHVNLKFYKNEKLHSVQS